MKWQLLWLINFFGFIICGITTGVIAIYYSFINKVDFQIIMIIIGLVALTLFMNRMVDFIKIRADIEYLQEKDQKGRIDSNA